MKPSLARELGIEVIYQEFNLVSSLSVAENLFLGSFIGNGMMINKARMYQETEKIFKENAREYLPAFAGKGSYHGTDAVSGKSQNP